MEDATVPVDGLSQETRDMRKDIVFRRRKHEALIRIHDSRQGHAGARFPVEAAEICEIDRGDSGDHNSQGASVIDHSLLACYGSLAIVETAAWNPETR
jgi:hypothetical protein